MFVPPKHPLWVRVTHWINFPALTMMVWSGILIYWANRAYWPNIPNEWWVQAGLDHRLAKGMSFHFFFMWIFAINGLVYAFWLLKSGEWRELFPNRESARWLIPTILHDVGLSKATPPPAKFNAAQKFAYTGALFLGAAAVVSGIAIYKPVQISWLTVALGGYETARLIHYIVLWGFFLFFTLHILQVIRAGWANFRPMLSAHRVASGASALAGSYFVFSLFLYSLGHVHVEDGVPWPLRRVLDMNGAIGTALLKADRIDRAAASISVPKGKPARANGNIGLNAADEAAWKIEVEIPGENSQSLSLTMADVKALPFKEIHSQFRCIEGWSEDMSFGGVSFVDFLHHYRLGTKSGQEANWQERPGDLYKYVGFETPDEEYYVNIDMKSLMSPNTMLAYQQNGEALTLAHGAPLRLFMPNKYGVKSLKQVGRIIFSDEPLPDYWGEEGYDHFVGL